VTTSLGVFITSMAAYTLSHREPMLNSICMKLIMVTMFFGGGLIPFYILVKTLKLLDTRWSIILPALVSTWNILIMRTSFRGMPDSLSESAKLDGANDFTIYARILMPLGGAVNAYVILLFAVGMWNAWFNASIFLSKPDYRPLQVILRDILIQNDLNAYIQSSQMTTQQGQEMDRVLVKYSTIIVAMVPILLVYPFLQKYFVSGVMIGSIKG
jgi:putative aldouronate transport system permease protein